MNDLAIPNTPGSSAGISKGNTAEDSVPYDVNFSTGKVSIGASSAASVCVPIPKEGEVVSVRIGDRYVDVARLDEETVIITDGSVTCIIEKGAPKNKKIVLSLGAQQTPKKIGETEEKAAPNISAQAEKSEGGTACFQVSFSTPLSSHKRTLYGYVRNGRIVIVKSRDSIPLSLSSSYRQNGEEKEISLSVSGDLPGESRLQLQFIHRETGEPGRRDQENMAVLSYSVRF